MSASKVLDLAERQGFLEPKVISELRRQVAESKFVVTPEAIAKVLVDRGHLTPFQARKLVATALGEPPPEPEPSPAPAPQRKAVRGSVPDELGLADDESSDRGLRYAPEGPAAEEDFVILEAVDPAPPPAAKPAPAPRSVFTPPKSSAAKPEAKPLAATVEEDFVELEPIAPVSRPAKAAPPKPVTPEVPSVSSAARSKPASSWKASPRAPTSVPPEESTPIVSPEPARPQASPPSSPAPVTTGALAPLDDLMADPLAMPADPMADKSRWGTPLPGGKKKRNAWDSPLLLVGGGLLGVMIVAFGLLWFSLTRGTAAQFFEKAEEEYRNGSYSSALAAYDTFLNRYPDNPNASLAKVRRGMAELRQVTEQGQNPKQGLLTAKRVLPEIESEEKFSEARGELATILPDIADGFASIAAQAKETAQKEELLSQADEAMKLVNNTAYLPPSIRKERETRIAGILDKLKVAQRSIEQDKDLAGALEKIAAAEQKGQAASAYQVRADLLKLYPGLDVHPDLDAAIRRVGDKERELVEVAAESVAAATEDSPPIGARIHLAVRQGPQPAASPAKFAFVPVEGAIYGLDAASGRVLWRRHVGYETLVPPQPLSREAGADVLVTDARKHELLRLAAATGKVVWRQAIGQPFFAPALAGERIFVTTKSGRILQIDAAGGTIQTAAQLPQEATVPAAFDARQSRLVQLGEHSTLFVHSAASLECTETYYLGHSSGAVLVPPVSVLDHVIAVESPADDYTLLHVLATNPESKRLTRSGKPFRLRGRVVMPLAVAGRRVVAMTDLGQIAVYEVDPTNKQQPVRAIAGLEATERTPALGFYTADANRLWLASRRCSMFEIQPSVQNLARRWSKYQDDVFVGPLVSAGDVLVHVRRRPGLPGVVITGCEPATGTAIWETQVAAPLAGLLPAAMRQGIDAISLQGRVFQIAPGQAAIVEAPAFPLPQESAGSIWPETSPSGDGLATVWTETHAGGRVFRYDVASGSAPASVELPDGAAAAAGAVAWGKNVVVPVTSGKVELLDPSTGKRAALPFQPPLSPDSLPPWTRPALAPAGDGFVIGDGKNTLFRIAVKQQPQVHLAAVMEQTVPLELHGSLALAGDTLYGLGQSEAGETLVAIDPQSLAVGQRRPISGKALFSPESVGGSAFVATEADGLFCLEGGQQLRWQKPLLHGPLSGPPVAGPSGELLLLYQSGMLSRVSAESGEELAKFDVGEPLGRVACLAGEQVVVSTSDGGVVTVPLPK